MTDRQSVGAPFIVYTDRLEDSYARWNFLFRHVDKDGCAGLDPVAVDEQARSDAAAVHEGSAPTHPILHAQEPKAESTLPQSWGSPSLTLARDIKGLALARHIRVPEYRFHF